MKYLSALYNHSILKWQILSNLLSIEYISGYEYRDTFLECLSLSNFLLKAFVFVNLFGPSNVYMRQLSNHHWFRQWLVAWSAPSHCLNQCWNIVNWTLENKFQWNRNRNSNILIQENAFEYVVCQMASISSLPRCVKWVLLRYAVFLLYMHISRFTRYFVNGKTYVNTRMLADTHRHIFTHIQANILYQCSFSTQKIHRQNYNEKRWRCR